LPEKIAQYRKLLEKKPNFDRNGVVKTSWVAWLMALGGGSAKTLILKYVAIIIGMPLLDEQASPVSVF